jgi:hypothetical protein
MQSPRWSPATNCRSATNDDPARFSGGRGALAVACGFASPIVWRTSDEPANALFLRDRSVPRALLPHSRWDSSEALFRGDYAALVDLARTHFARGGTHMLAAIDTAGALLLVHALRGRPGLRVTEQSLPVSNITEHFKLVVVASGSKARP